MLTTINTEVGDPSANSYVSVEEADAYFAGRYLSGEGWSGFTEAQKVARLWQAAIAIDRLPFIGRPASVTQAMQWPRRSGVLDHEYSSLVVQGVRIPLQVVPQAIKYAQAELALVIFDDDGNLPSLDGSQIKSETLGKWSISYEPDVEPLLAAPVVLDFLFPYLLESTRLERT
jgi:hypothetical protein